MSRYQNTASESWDLGFSDMIEETPFINPKQPTQFVKVGNADTVNLYLKRPQPSWSGLPPKNTVRYLPGDIVRHG